MARKWTMEAAQALLKQWNSRMVESSVRDAGLAAELNSVAVWLLDQRPDSLDEADRLLDLIVAYEAGDWRGVEAICGIGGGVRYDAQTHHRRIETSFAPRASGLLAGRA